MSSADTPLMREGKLILRLRDNEDGSVLLYKPMPLKKLHILKMTGAPGWDAAYVDQSFPPGVDGVLRYTYELVDYSISIERFREHMFKKDFGAGEQYHCALRWWTPKGHIIVNPLRAETDREQPITKLEFGATVPCGHCKGRGLKYAKSEACEACHGLGVVRWSSTSPTKEAEPPTSTSS